MNLESMLPGAINRENDVKAASWDELNEQIITCRLCPRLVEWRENVSAVKRRAYADWEYWGRPVPGFGDPQARLLVIGLAPGAHGSNRTGRMFTGDASGDFFYPALYRAGFANQPESVRREDGLRLTDVFVSATARCAPPDNKPLPEEIRNCRRYLLKEMEFLPNIQGIVLLGKIAFDQILNILGGAAPKPVKFAHGAFYEMQNGLPWLLASYHPSRQNTQTGRLTQAMFDEIWQTARAKLR